MTDGNAGILERQRDARWRVSWPARVAERIHEALPHGQMLPEHILRRRHRCRLQRNGCDTAQGFLFSRPEAPDVVARLLRQ